MNAKQKEQQDAVGLGPRRFQVGDKAMDWEGRHGTITIIQTIINKVAPHHRVKMSYADSVFGYSEGAENNFSPFDWPNG